MRHTTNILLLSLACLLFIPISLWSQTPQAVNYQAVVRDGNGMILPNQNVQFQISMIAGMPTGNAVYTETHTVTTSDLGLVQFEIGGGNVVSGTFSSIDWGGNTYFTKMELDVNGGTNFVDMGTSQLISVPYALHARTVEIDQVDDADADPANEINTGINLTGTDLSITDGGGTQTVSLATLADGDGDATNELQTISASGGNITLSQGGGTLSLNDPDADPTNEIQTLSQNGTDLTLSNNGGTVSINDADADSTNELNTGFTLSGTDLSLTDAGGTQTVNLASLADGDGDATNELQTLTLSGGLLALSQGGGIVPINDADSDPANEMQTLTQAGSDLTLSGNGGTVSINDADADPVNELQTLTQAGSDLTLSGNGGTVSINDADADPNNELQTLSFSGHDLTLSNGGGTMNLSGYMDGQWARFNNRIYTLGTTIGIGTSSPVTPLEVRGDITVRDNSPVVHLSVDQEVDGKILFSDFNAPASQSFELAFNAGNEDLHFRSDDSPNDIMTLLHEGGTSVREHLYVTHGNGITKAAMTSGGSNLGANIDTYGPSLHFNCRMTALGSGGLANHGYIGVYPASNFPEAGLYVDGNGNGIVWGDVKNFRMDHPSQPGKEIWYASIEGPEAAAYERGTATMINGQATVIFSNHFQEVGNSNTLTVLITPLSGASKGIAVVEKKVDGFSVQELHNGNGNYAFDWEVKAVRKGYEDYRVIRDASELEHLNQKQEPYPQDLHKSNK